jgi:hypothetical protein
LLPHHGGEVLAPFAQHLLVDMKPLAMLTLGLYDKVHMGDAADPYAMPLDGDAHETSLLQNSAPRHAPFSAGLGAGIDRTML